MAISSKITLPEYPTNKRKESTNEINQNSNSIPSIEAANTSEKKAEEGYENTNMSA